MRFIQVSQHADILTENGKLKGILTGDLGVGSDGQQTGQNYQPGIEIHSKYTLFAEGCRGHLGKKLIEEFDLGEKL